VPVAFLRLLPRTFGCSFLLDSVWFQEVSRFLFADRTPTAAAHSILHFCVDIHRSRTCCHMMFSNHRCPRRNDNARVGIPSSQLPPGPRRPSSSMAVPIRSSSAEVLNASDSISTHI
jgi:hypothetical protein